MLFWTDGYFKDKKSDAILLHLVNDKNEAKNENGISDKMLYF